MAVVRPARPGHAIGGDVVDPVPHPIFFIPSERYPPAFLPQPLQHDVLVRSFVAYER
jgi:hypothetical protein